MVDQRFEYAMRLTHGLESFRISYGAEQCGLSCLDASDKRRPIFNTTR